MSAASFNARHAFVLDEFRGAESFDFAPISSSGEGDGGALDIEVDEIAIERALRQVGAGVVGLAIGDGVQRIQGDEGAPARAKESMAAWRSVKSPQPQLREERKP